MEASSKGVALLVISILVSGYILASFCYFFRYQTARESGHRLYLTSASLGFIATIIVEFILFSLQSIATLLSHLPWVNSTIDFFAPAYHALLLGALTPTLSITYSLIYNKRKGAKNKNLRRAWEKDDFSSLLNYATQTLKPIAVTLESRKVYIGLVARTNEPDASCSHLTLLPYYSGYRDSETLHLSITNIYDSVFDYYKNDGSEAEIPIEDMYIVLPLTAIVSSHIFNADVYESLNKNQHIKR